MRKPLLFFLFCLVSLSHAAQTPSRWLFEFNYGQVNTTYFERIEGTAADVQVEQKSDWSEVVLQYFLAPPYFELTFAGQFTGASIDEPEDETQQIQIATGIASTPPLMLRMMLSVLEIWWVGKSILSLNGWPLEQTLF